MTTHLLEARGLAAGYGKVEVLKDISLWVAKYSVTCVVGPNGAGKTTLMAALAGLLSPRRGTIRFDGHDIAGRPPHVVMARGIALVSQNRLLFHRLTVRENLWAGAHRRTDKLGIEADIARFCERFPRLGERRDQLAGTLSGGEQQMLAIARALMSRPTLLLLDEPAHGLAPLLVEDVYRLIGEINAQGTTVLLVEQNAPLAFAAAHHVYFMDRGRMSDGADPARLAHDPRIHEANLGTASNGTGGVERPKCCNT
ncbi:MAG: ABC transporter ATP-binding protein [Sulfurifustaceae bacterium]